MVPSCLRGLVVDVALDAVFLAGLDDLLDWEVFLLSALVVFLLPLTTGVNSKSLLMSESSGEGRE